MHSKIVKKSLSFIICSSIYSSISSTLFCSASKNHVEYQRDLFRPPYSEKDMFHLGSFDDKDFTSGEITLVKSELTSDLIYKLVVGSQFTTGSIWFCADVYAGTEYKFTNHNYGDLKMMLTTDYKSHLARYGLVKHGFKVDPFKELEDYDPSKVGIVGAPEKMYTFVTVSKDVKAGDYVLLFAYGRTFSDDLPKKFKEFKVKVV